ncbi:MAG: lipid-A-disaccharide synthase [Candidatus Omnitrophica bacterium]|nr:lipid-A-disaccharide synthase [Candidatus Omnitrophota bacterium]
MKKILIVAGEHSGDRHGANLIRDMKSLRQDISFTGLGGPLMATAGAKLYRDMTEIAVVGFIEVLKHYSEFKKIFKDLVSTLDSDRPDMVILIDYPGFNMRLAREVKKRNIPLVYYISPQIWAWGKKRIKTIRETVDLMVVFFDFEKELYEKEGVPVEWVGHPFVDSITPTGPKEIVLDMLGLAKEKKTILLLPGSRRKEVEKILPIMLEAAVGVCKRRQDVQFLISKPSSMADELYESELRKYDLPIKLTSKKNLESLTAADFVIVASGSSTLETAVMGKPMVIVYKVSPITALMVRLLITLPYVGLVNVVAGKRIVPEFLQGDAKPDSIAYETVSILNDPMKQIQMKSELNLVKKKLGSPGASMRAAQAILKLL